MGRIIIDIADEILEEAGIILESLGLNIEIATNIFLRRVILEKGLPLSMTRQAEKTVPTKVRNEKQEKDAEEVDDKEVRTGTSTYKRITEEMVEEVWRSFLLLYKHKTPINVLSTELAKKTGMNWGSASIYLNFLLNLVNGESHFRTMKIKDLEFLMEKIEEELGEAEYQQAKKSLRKSIPYWRENLTGRFADKIEEYLKKLN